MYSWNALHQQVRNIKIALALHSISLFQQQHGHVDVDENAEDIAQAGYKRIAHHGWVQAEALEYQWQHAAHASSAYDHA